MKRSEVLKKNYDAIAEEMKEKHEQLMRCENRAGYEVKVYVWEDGETECLIGEGWLQPKQNEERDLIYVATVKDMWCEDEDVDDVVSDYDPTWLIDSRIDELEQEEEEQ